jgi:hypothetical protein
MIDNYRFGEIEINGKSYRNDVIIYPDRVNAHWWRKEGHNLEVDDIREVIDAKPDTIVIGTGQPGFMQVEKGAIEYIQKLGIKTIIVPTETACQEYNKIAKTRKVIACLHLTC